MDREGIESIRLTGGEETEITETLDRIDPADTNRGVLVYYNGEGSGPIAHTVPDAFPEYVTEGAGTADGGASLARKAIAGLFSLLVFAYGLLVVQKLLLGLLVAAVVYVSVLYAGTLS